MIEPHELNNTTFRCSIPVRNYLDIYFVYFGIIYKWLNQGEANYDHLVTSYKQGKKAVLTNFFLSIWENMKKLVFCFQQKLPIYCSWLLCCCNMFTFVWTSGKQTRKLHYQQCWLLKQPHYQQQAPASKQGNYDGRKMNYNWKEGKK